MGERKDSVRGRVILAWKSASKPNWDIEKTIAVCKEVDSEFEREGPCPAPAFRRAIKSDDRSYIKVWVYGCHYPWLNPR